MAEHMYPWIKPILTHISATENSSILAPYGSSLVTGSLSQGKDINNMDGSLATASVEESLHIPISKNVIAGMRQLEDTAADVE